MLIVNQQTINAVMYGNQIIDFINYEKTLGSVLLKFLDPLSLEGVNDISFSSEQYFKKQVDPLKESFLEQFKLGQIDSAVLTSNLDLVKS